MKKIIFLFLCVFFCVSISHAQQTYKKVKVTLKDGFVTKGTKATLTDESLSFMMKGDQKTYSLSDVTLVQAREGKAGKWALWSGGGCLGIVAIAGIASGSEGIEEAGGTVGTYVAGAILWTGIAAGVGALIGSATDKYENVYISPRATSFLNKINLNLSSKQLSMNNPSKYNLTLSYKF
jgi:hypothetical protein